MLILRNIIDSFFLLSWLNICSLKKCKTLPFCLYFPQHLFFQSYLFFQSLNILFHSDLDNAPNTETSTFKTEVTDNVLELSFEVDCTRVTNKKQTTSLKLPKDWWRTEGFVAARHYNLHRAEEKVNNSLLSLQTYVQTIGRIRKEKGFHPLKDSKAIMFP